jgi:hypothetical protein
MSTVYKVFFSISLAAIAAMTQSARADTSNATCRFYKNNEKIQNASGPCLFSQRQGHISIELRGGNTVKLSPRNKADQFKDQNDNKVDRTGTYGSTQVFKWRDKNKKLIVNFSNTAGTRQGHQSSGQMGETPHNLRDLLGARTGQAEGQLQARGYEYRNGSKSAGVSYSNWKDRSTGRCVTIRTEQGRYQSIIYSSEVDCNASDRHHPG